MIYNDENTELRYKDEYSFVEADNKENAWEKVVNQHFINKEHVLDFVMSKSVNEGLCEVMFRDSKGWFYNDFGPGYRDELCESYNNDNDKILKYITIVVKENIKRFFEDNQEYINLYIEHIFNHDKDTKFPKDMLIFMIRKEYKKYYKIEPISIIK